MIDFSNYSSIKAAFYDGFYSSATYNDILVNTADEAWEKADLLDKPTAWMFDRVGSEHNPHLMLAGKIADELRLGRHIGNVILCSPCPNHVNWVPLYT